ncbi:MAG: chloride channel protein [Actinobacteria bacterium]|nr:chloride channel protein [Actinomycetota bacterium]
MGRRFHLTLVLSMVIGVLTGLGVAGFDSVVKPAIDRLADQPMWVVALAPAAGLIVVNVLTVVWRDGDTATTDAYVRAYHQRGGTLRLSSLWRKTVASAITLGSGNAFGFEGPSMLIGGTIGATVDGRFASRLRRDDAKVLMVAGAAAGVAAVFKAPLTGVIFALEVPYRSDLARRALLPSLVAAGSAYVTFVALIGTTPLLPAGGAAPFDLRDLGGGLALGVVCGLLARLGAQAIGCAKGLRLSRWWCVALAASGMIALAPIARWWFDAPLHLGPSYAAIEWAAAPGRTVTVLCGLFALRAAATWLGVAGGGMGGLFIPLVTQGAIVGSIFEHVVDSPNPHLFPTIGIAAFLGAGYRTPLAGVAFVAEATGEPGFLVPALLAAAAAQLVMGGKSFSTYQRNERLPDIEPLSRLAVGDIMSPSADTIEADLDLERVIAAMLRQNRRWAPVVDESGYVGLIAVTDISLVPMKDWQHMNARDVARTDLAPAAPTDTVDEVAERMRAVGSEAVAVTRSGTVIGVVTLRDLTNIEVLLDRLNNESS